MLPRFEEQIRQGGPLTVTDPDAYRYFMSVDEAVRLVLQSAAIARPGRVYVLDMGEDLRMVHVAERLAGLHGLRVPDDIEIVFTGLRPGERLRESLIGCGESLHPTIHPKVRELVGLESRSPAHWKRTVATLSMSAATCDDQQLRNDLFAALTSSGENLSSKDASPQNSHILV